MGTGRAARDPGGLPSIEIHVDDADDAPPIAVDEVPAHRNWSVVLAVIAAVLGLAGLWVFSGLASNEGPGNVVAAPPDEPAFVVPTSVPTPTPSPIPRPTPNVVVETRVSQAAKAELATAGPAHAVAYASGGAIGVVDLSTGDAWTIDPGFVSLSFDVGVAEDARALGLGDADLGTLARIATGELVAVTGDGASLTFAAGLGDVVFDLDLEGRQVSERHDVPAGARLSAIDGYGITAFVEGEGTYVFAGGEPTLFTAGQLVAANDEAWLERRCVQRCQLVLVDARNGNEQLLPEELAVDDSSYLISPRGDLVLHVAPDGSGELYEAASGSSSWVSSAGIRDPAWAPDSTFLAWIDTTQEPRLKLLSPGGPDVIAVDLELLGAPSPSGGEMTVVLRPDD